MIPAVARREVTLREWWELRRESWTKPGRGPVSIHTVEAWRKWRDGFPKPAKMHGRTAVYYLTDLDAWKRSNPEVGTGE